MKVTQSIAAMLVISAAFALSGCKGGSADGPDGGSTPGHLDSSDSPPPKQGDTETPPPSVDRLTPPADELQPPPIDAPPPEDTQPTPIGSENPVTNEPPPVSDPPPVTLPPEDPLPKPSTGSATLTWEAPTQNTDGSALTNLSGFVIYYGTKPSDLTASINLPTPGVMIYVVDGLTAGKTYYFSVTATTSAGQQSAQSSVVSKSI